MQFKHENVESFRINAENQQFRISSNQAPDLLRDSVERLGLLDPPILLPTDHRFTVVSGFKRIEAARDLGWKKIPCKLLPPDVSIRLCVRIAISQNTTQRTLDIIEVSRALALLKSSFEKADVPGEALRLGLPANQGRIDELEPLCKLPPRIVNAVRSDSIAVPVALDLSKMSEKEADAFADIFLSSNCSLNKQREIVQMAREIGLRDDQSISDVLLKNTLRSIVKNPDLDKNRKAREIRSYLRKIRYPNVVEAEKNFAETVELLGLEPGMKLIPPKDFEGSAYVLHLGFRNVDELKKRSEKLREMLNGPEIEKLFE